MITTVLLTVAGACLAWGLGAAALIAVLDGHHPVRRLLRRLGERRA